MSRAILNCWMLWLNLVDPKPYIKLCRCINYDKVILSISKWQARKYVGVISTSSYSNIGIKLKQASSMKNSQFCMGEPGSLLKWDQGVNHRWENSWVELKTFEKLKQKLHMQTRQNKEFIHPFPLSVRCLAISAKAGLHNV